MHRCRFPKTFQQYTVKPLYLNNPPLWTTCYTEHPPAPRANFAGFALLLYEHLLILNMNALLWYRMHLYISSIWTSIGVTIFFLSDWSDKETNTDNDWLSTSLGWLISRGTKREKGIEYQLIDDEPPIEQAPCLPDALKMIRRLHILSTTQYPELYPFLIQIQSKLSDVYLTSKVLKQCSILDFFRRA